MTVEVLDAAGSSVYSETVALPGRTVALHCHGHEEPDCGGTSELAVRVARREGVLTSRAWPLLTAVLLP